MELDFPDPNEALAECLVGPEIYAALEAVGKIAHGLYVAEVAKRSGRLAGSAFLQTEIGGVHKDRYVSHLTVGVGLAYGAAHQFGHWQDESHLIGSSTAAGESQVFIEGAHELNRVLEQIGSI